jgi:hypothetical protein
MNQPSRRFSVMLIAVLAGAIVVSSGPPLMAVAQQSGQSEAGQSQSGESSAGAQNNESLPEAPQAQSTQSPPQTTPPSGAAGAKAAAVKGAPVAQPVGAAVAPARQRGHHSLLIKVGLAAGAAIAVGTVVALSAKSPTRPPGSTASTQ